MIWGFFTDLPWQSGNEWNITGNGNSIRFCAQDYLVLVEQAEKGKPEISHKTNQLLAGPYLTINDHCHSINNTVKFLSPALEERRRTQNIDKEFKVKEIEVYKLNLRGAIPRAKEVNGSLNVKSTNSVGTFHNKEEQRVIKPFNSNIITM